MRERSAGNKLELEGGREGKKEGDKQRRLEQQVKVVVGPRDWMARHGLCGQLVRNRGVGLRDDLFLLPSGRRDVACQPGPSCSQCQYCSCRSNQSPPSLMLLLGHAVGGTRVVPADCEEPGTGMTILTGHEWSSPRRPVSVCDPKLSRLSTFRTRMGQSQASIETEPERVESVSSVPFRLC